MNNFALCPDEWLFWDDKKFNDWRRKNDFPRIVDFLFETLPFFSLWLSEQSGLSRKDLIFHGPARFIRLYGEPMRFVELDVSFSLHHNHRPQPILRYCFVKKDDKQVRKKRVTRSVEFSSYFDWAAINKSWVFYNNISGIEEFVTCLTPSGRFCKTSSYIDSNSSIQFNIPCFMPSVTINELLSSTNKKCSPPSLELLKLGGGGVTVVDGILGEKNLEFTNIDNITLINPIITSFQDVSYSTLRNLNIVGHIHAATFHQCTIDVNVSEGELYECSFEYCNSKINLSDSKLSRSSVRERFLRLSLKDTEVSDCCFEYLNINGGPFTERESFNKSAKMIYSHLGYPDLAGRHYYLEKKEKRKGLWNKFSSLDSSSGIGRRILTFLAFIWMAFQEIYWGYGERPFNIVVVSLFFILSLSLFGFFNKLSCTHFDLVDSLIYSFQSFANIRIKEIQQGYDVINLIGSFLSFFGIMSIGLLIAALSAKTKNYN